MASPPAPVPALADDESMFSVPGPSMVQFVVGGIAAGFTNEPESECASIMEEQDEEAFDATVPMGEIIARRRAALKVLITPEPEEQKVKSSEPKPPGTPEATIKRWTLRATDDETRDGTQVELVVKPTASKMVYTALHPAIYRYLKPLHDLDQVAEHLGGVEGWRAEASRIWPVIRNQFREFVNLPTMTSESLIERQLMILIGNISLLLRRRCRPDGRTATTVHGTLALDYLDVRGVADIFFSSGGRCIIAAEVKTIDSWPAEQYWYRESRGVKLFNALYGFHCPTLLVTQGHFKLFLENDDRDSVYTFPFKKTADTASMYEKLKASVSWHPTDLDLLKVLVMLVMKGDPKAEGVEPSNKPSDVLAEFLSDSVPGKPDHAGQFTAATPHKSADATQQTHSSLTVNRARGEPADPTMPRFYTGVNDEHGNPIYQLVYASRPQVPDFSDLTEFSSDESSDEFASSELASDSSESEAVLPNHDSAVAL